MRSRPRRRIAPRAPLFFLTETGHGRVETRALATFAIDGMEMDFPYARSVVVVRSQRHIKKNGETSQEARYYLSSLDPGERSLEAWHQLIRGHWAGVEIRNHWRRDALFGEDRSRSRNANLLANLALIRTGLLRLASNKFPGQSIPEI